VTAALQHELIWGPLPRRFLAVVDCSMPSGERGCTQRQCRYHLAHTGLGDHRTRPTRDCALTVANERPRTLDEVANVLVERIQPDRWDIIGAGVALLGMAIIAFGPR
jgi:hypothetical protein